MDICIDTQYNIYMDNINASTNDRDALLQSEIAKKKPLHEGDMNTEERDLDENITKKKYLKYGIAGLVVFLIIVGIVVAVLVTRTYDDNHPDDYKPSIFYNPYTLQSTNYTLPRRLTGELTFNAEVQGQNKFLEKTQEQIQGNIGVDFKKIPSGENNKMITKAKFTFSMLEWRTAHFQLEDADHLGRYQVPDDILKVTPQEGIDEPDHPNMRLEMVGFNYTQSDNKQFGFSFSDPMVTEGDNWLVKHDDKCSLVFMDKFLLIEFELPSQRVFGFGERMHEMQLKEGVYGMWSKAGPNQYDSGATARQGSYGVHPFLLVQGRRKDDFIGLYFKNSNYMSPILTYNPDGTSKLTYITTGGILDIFFFLHGSVATIVKNYRNFIGGKPSLPPFWALGWQQANPKWSTYDEVNSVIEKYHGAGLPLEVLHLGKKFLDLSQKQENKIEMNVTNGKYYVLEVSSTVKANASGEEYIKGDSQNLFLKSMMYKSAEFDNNLVNFNSDMEKQVYLNWQSETIKSFWKTRLDGLYEKNVQYDGISFMDNIPCGQCQGEIPHDATMCPASATSLKDQIDESWYSAIGDQKNKSTYNLPFLPGFNKAGNLDNTSISLNATHLSTNLTEYDLHSLYGAYSLLRASEYFNQLTDDLVRADQRPFILSLSTFTRSGIYGSHILGQNDRSYEHLKLSISQVMNMNLFGVPHSGPYICGFLGEKRNDQLCTRWIQIAQFYPLTVFANSPLSEDNEPFQITEEPHKSMVKRAMYDRFSYLRLLYTCLYETTQGDPVTGTTCFDPLFYTYPLDDKVYEDDSSFMFAGSIKVSPVLQEQTDNFFDSYFPTTTSGGQYVSLQNTSEILECGLKQVLSATSISIQAHLIPGKIIPYQPNSGFRYNNTQSLINSSITLLVNPDQNGYAEGSLFLDQGSKKSELTKGQFEYYRFSFGANSLQVQLSEGSRGSQDGFNLETVSILNPKSLGKNLSTIEHVCFLDSSNNLEPVPLTANFYEQGNTLEVFFSKVDPVPFSSVHSIHLSFEGEFSPCTKDNFLYKLLEGQENKTSNQSNQTVLLQPLGNKGGNISVKLRLIEGKLLNVKLGWGSAPRFEVPQEFVNTTGLKEEGQLDQYVTLESNNETGAFSMKFRFSKSAKDEYFAITGMAYEEHLTWINAEVSTEANDTFRGIYGLGQRANPDFFYEDGVYSIYSRSKPGLIDSGSLPSGNWYGAQPYFMYKHASYQWVGVFYNLASAQDWWIKNNKTMGRVSLKTVAVGGTADIWLFPGSSPEDVMRQYYKVIGKPVLPPQWMLGWNQCRYGYKSLDAVKAVVEGYIQGHFPLDVMWSDVDYMNNYRNFQYDDQQAYIGLPAFIETLHNRSMKYVPILDAATSARPRVDSDYAVYRQAVEAKALITLGGEPFIGQVWPNDAAFPDFMPKGTGTQWWQENLASFWKLLAFDGLWLDMNEGENFCKGSCYPTNLTSAPLKTKLKYVPTGRDLEISSLSLDAQHLNGQKVIDTHSLYAIGEHKATSEWFTQEGKRTMIISRSHYAGSGKWASTWLGDNISTEKEMALSVPGIMMSNIFGMPIAGSDICGFIGNTTQNLCTKWHVLGAFYPFSRNHNNWWERPQEPYVWDLPTQESMRHSIYVKYSLNRYYYTTLFDISISGTGTFFKPLFHEFPEDPQASKNDTLYKNIMLGASLKLSIDPHRAEVGELTDTFYFPEGTWCILSGNLGKDGKPCLTAPVTGLNVTFPSNLTDYQLHIREGSIVPYQDLLSNGNTTDTYLQVPTLKDLQELPIQLHILGQLQEGFLAGLWRAIGRYVNDDGEVLSQNLTYNGYALQAGSNDTESNSLYMLFANPESQRASNLINGTARHCWAVNGNDYVETLVFHNALGLKMDSDYTVSLTLLPDYKNVTLPEGKYDAERDEVVVRMGYPGDKYCMAQIAGFSLVKKFITPP